MSEINEVRERLAAIAREPGARVSAESDDLRALLADHARLQAELNAAARSLRTIANQAGRCECLETIDEVRGYASSRAGVAERALAVQP